MTRREAFDIIVKYVPICFKDELETIEKNLEALDFFKKLFIDIMQFQIVDIQDYKYLAFPNYDPRKPDALLPISEKEYKLLKELLENL